MGKVECDIEWEDSRGEIMCSEAWDRATSVTMLKMNEEAGGAWS